MLTGSVQDCGPIRFCRVDWNPLQVGFGFSTDHCDQCSRLIENPRYSFVFKAPHQWFICRSWMSAGVYSMYQFGSFWGEKQQFVVARLPTSATGPPDNIPLLPPPSYILYIYMYEDQYLTTHSTTRERGRYRFENYCSALPHGDKAHSKLHFPNSSNRNTESV